MVECIVIFCLVLMGFKDMDGDGCYDVCVNFCIFEECGFQFLLFNYECFDGEIIVGLIGVCWFDENQICGWVIVECFMECEFGD